MAAIFWASARLLRRLHLGIGLGGDADGLAFGLALRADQVGQLAPLGDLALARREGLLLGLDRLGADGLGCCHCRGTLLRLLGDVDGLLDFRDLDRLVVLDAHLADLAVLDEASLVDAARRLDARPLDFLAGGDLGLLEGLPLGDLQRFQIAFALDADLVEHAVLADARRSRSPAWRGSRRAASRLPRGLPRRPSRRARSDARARQSPAPRLRWISSSLCARSRSMRAFSSSSSSAICSRSVFSRDFSSASSRARRRAISRRCVSSSLLMRSSVMARSCASRDFSTLSRADSCACSDSWSRSARSLGEFRALPGAANLDLALLLQARIFAVAVDLQHLALRVEILVADVDQRALLDLVAHPAARFDRFRSAGVRPSASKAFDGSKNSRLVWSRSTMATLSSSRPFCASASDATSLTWRA